MARYVHLDGRLALTPFPPVPRFPKIPNGPFTMTRKAYVAGIGLTAFAKPRNQIDYPEYVLQ